MAQNNFHVEAFAPSGERILRAKVRYRGDNGLLSAVNWITMMGFEGKPRQSVQKLGTTVPVLTLDFPNIVVRVTPELDEKNQCPACGYPKEAPNDFCHDENGCEAFRSEPEVVVDLDDAQAQLAEMFS